MKKLSATDAINLYEKSLSALPGIRSLHVGFDEDRPVIIVTADEITDALEESIEAIAPNAPIKIIQVGTKKPDTGSDPATSSGKSGGASKKKNISPSEAKDRYGKKIRALKTVTSINVGKKSGQDVLVVRAFPLTESIKSAVIAVAPNVQLEFKESPHSKTSAPSIFNFIINKLKFLIILLAAGEILFVLLSPLYYATDDIKFAITASSIDGVVVTAERPVANPNNRDDISQEVTIKFSARIGTVLFTQEVPLFKTLSLDNMNAEPYHKGETVAVAFKSDDPQNTARIFDRGRFWATLILYTAALIFMVQIALRARKHWQEW